MASAAAALAAATVLLGATASADHAKPSEMTDARSRLADPWFPQVGDNLTRVSWAHAVNDRAYLAAVLASDVMMIEADIVLGHLTGAESSPPLPVMAHPPATVSDLSLEDFLASVTAHNAAADPELDARKGVKLDFKSIEAFEASELLVARIAGDKMAYPVWLNADILPGPGYGTSAPVDAERFLRVASGFPRATLSVGWTTLYAGSSAQYAAGHAAAMLSALRAHGATRAVTFPVRAGLAAGSASVLRALLSDTAALLQKSCSGDAGGSQESGSSEDVAILEQSVISEDAGILQQSDGSEVSGILQRSGSSEDAGLLQRPGCGAATLTVWSGEDDAVDAAAVRELVLAVGVERVYLDVPAELAARLHLPDSAVTS